MKKAIFNSVQHYGNVHGNDSQKTFTIDYFNALGFISLSSNMKQALEIAKGLNVVDFDNGKKALVKVMEQKKGTIFLFVAGNGFFAHVIPANGKAFSRKAPKVNNCQKQFRAVKAIVGKLLRKKELATSNMLQTRICNEIV